jgi:hypothetical protein
MKQHNGYDVKLTIHVATDTVFDKVNIIGSFENHSINDFYLINHNRYLYENEYIYISYWPKFEWYLEILFSDTIQMNNCPLIIAKILVGERDDYLLIRSGEEYVFNFDVNFVNLTRETDAEYWTCNNVDFGEYIIRLTYNRDGDSFVGGFRKKFRGKVESNKIRIIYKEK